MAEGISPTNQTVPLPVLACNTRNSGIVNRVRPPAASEYNQSSDDPFFSKVSTTSGQPLSTHIPRTSWSRDASPGSFIEHVYSEKIPEKSPRRRLYRQPTLDDRGKTRGSKALNGTLTPLRNGIYSDSMADDPSKPTIPQHRKSGGLRTAIRRIFGRKSTKNRISLPNLAEGHDAVSY